MFKHILLATDGSPASEAAASACIGMARETGARITALHVIPPLHLFTYEPVATEAVHEQYRHARDVRAKEILGLVEQRAAQAGVPCTTMLATADQPYEAIIDTARTQLCDLVMMASHGRRGVAGLLLGSQTQKVLTHSLIPVLVFR